MVNKRGGLSRLTSLVMMVVAAFTAFVMVYAAITGVQDGVVLHRGGGMSLRATEPFRFWLDITVQFAIGLLFAGLSVFAGYVSVRGRP